MCSPLVQTSSIERVYRRISKVLQRLDCRPMKGKSTHCQRYWEAQQMVQSYDDVATALVSIYFLCISILTPLDTGCEQWLGHEDNQKWYPLLLKKIDFSCISSLAQMQSIFSHFLIGPVSILLRTGMHACTSNFFLIWIPLHTCTSEPFGPLFPSLSS